MLDNSSGKFYYTTHVFDRTEICDLSDDYTLPDYMPAIGRVLTCTAAAAQPTLYLGAGGVECAGGVRYSLLYESADDATLHCAELPGEYDVMLTPDRDAKTSTEGSDVSGICDTALENVIARVTAPRRLTVRSKLRLRPALRAKNEFLPIVRGADVTSEDLRTLRDDALCTACACATAIPVICRDSISFAEAGLSPEDEIRVISSHGNVMINQLQSTETGAECRGDINLAILISRVDGSERPRRIIRKLPFSASLPFDAPLPTNAKPIGIRGYGICPSVTHSVESDAISIEASILISAEAAASMPISYLKDLYSLKANCETSHDELLLHSPASSFNGHATVSASHDLASLGSDSGIKLCDVSAIILPDIVKELSLNGKLTLAGKMRISAIADNGAEFIPLEYDSDFRYTADLSDAIGVDSPSISAVMSVGDIKCRVDNENIICDCEICAAVLIESNRNIKLLTEVNIIPTTTETDVCPSMRVCYPTTGETLWDIAKKYRIDVTQIAEKNPISSFGAPDAPDSLAKIKFLIV